MNVDLNIERLVLHGVAVRDTRLLQRTVAAELTRLFTERGVPPMIARGGYVPRLDGDVVHATSVTRADGIGAQIARAVYGGFSR